MTPLEEQVEKLARAWDKDAEQIGGIRGDYAAGVSSTFQSAATQLRALLPLEVTDGKARITDEMVEAGAKGIYEVHTIEPTWEKATGWHKDTIRALSRGCLSAALTQKGEGNDGLYADQNCCVHCGWITCARLEDCLATEGDNES